MAPAAHSKGGPDLLHAFHQQVGRVFSLNQAMLPPELMRAFDQRVLLPWSTYAAQLFTLDSTIDQRRHVRAGWDAAWRHLRDVVDQRAPSQTATENPAPRQASTPRTAPAERAGSRPGRSESSAASAPRSSPPAGVRPRRASTLRSSPLTLAPEEVCARTESEFIELLRKIQARSGASVPRLAAEAGVPRSQLYSLLRRGRLPTKPEQVVAVIKAAGLTEEQVAQVMHLWTTLRALGSPGPARDYAILYEADEDQPERLHSQADIVRMISLAAGAEPVPWITHSDEQLDRERVRWLLRSSVRARAKTLAANADRLLPESHAWLSASEPEV
ncbi:hypothetical protein [Saccharothrix sp. NRRL B-16314]|uniref:hypothetical protein n=1 Tax=Saccharothrix sp. NRRL B-16314 TaxID=1463825 RepID=UPI0012DDB016|nr:hypothetical protein [Saccharothrix sp. NRRL B-16314]